MGRTSVASAVAGLLEDAAIRRVYTVPGESAIELLDILGHCRHIDVISTRHESGAGFMAEAEAKLTGHPAALVVNRAVGAANAAIAVHTARQDSTPMLVLLTQAKSTVLGREAFQEIDLAAFYRPLAKHVTDARAPERVPELLAEALRAATTGRGGPAAVVVPADYWASTVDEQPHLGAYPAPAPADVRPLADAITGARAPVAIVGGGARDARADLVAFAERYGVGVYAAWRRQDAFPNDHPAYLGHLGIGTDPRLLGGLRGADLVVALGTRLSETTTQGYTFPLPGCRVAQVDIEPSSISTAACPAIVADVGRTLHALLELPVAAVRGDWYEGHRAYLDSATPGEETSQVGAVHPAAVVAAMRDVLPEDTILTNDAGNFSGFLHRYWCYRAPRSQLAPTSGAMGYGVPAAVAAKLAAPERPVVAVVGDGGFLMTGNELETAVRYGTPLVCVVFRNGLYGSIATGQLKRFGRMTGVEIGDVDSAGYARALGCRGFTVTDADALRPALAAALDAGVPAVVDVATDPDVLTPVDRRAVLENSV
ncbi:MAG: thiamine pyrophosphate-dependent enzyme [Sciscionella sp.]